MIKINFELPIGRSNCSIYNHNIFFYHLLGSSDLLITTVSGSFRPIH